MELINEINETRESARKVREFLEKYRDYVFVCCVDEDEMLSRYEYVNRLGGYYIARAQDVLEDDSAVVEVLHKNDRWTVKVFQFTQDKNVQNELKNIILHYFGEDDAELIDYTSVQLAGQFLNIWDPWVGLDINFEKNKITITVTTLVQHCAEPAVHDDKFVFERVEKQWVVTECPEDYEPQYLNMIES